MINKIFMFLFGLLTAAVIYMTVMDIGVFSPSVEKHSLRDGSPRPFHRGGYRPGK